MSKTAPITIVMIAAATVGTAAIAQPVASPAPPPPQKRGAFECEIRDRNDRKFSLSGEMRDWEKTDRAETAIIDISAPRKSELEGQYQATFRGSQITIAKTGPIGQLMASGVLVADFDPEGTIMFRQRDGTSYVGFCDVRFTTNPEGPSA